MGLELLIFDWRIFIHPRLDTIITSGTAAVKNPGQAKNDNLLYLDCHCLAGWPLYTLVSLRVQWNYCTNFIGLLWELSELIYWTHLGQYLTPSECSGSSQTLSASGHPDTLWGGF